MKRRPPRSTLFPSPTLFRSGSQQELNLLLERNRDRVALHRRPPLAALDRTLRQLHPAVRSAGTRAREVHGASGDRKSTRLNSSHANISYAVFCLKKKKKTYM